MTLETYSRFPDGKHRCLELLAEHGVELPDTPPMALHRGRIDLLEEHLRRDPGLLTRTFAHPDIYPQSVRCHTDESLAGHGTPLADSTLIHMCVDYDEMDIARWLCRLVSTTQRSPAGCGIRAAAPRSRRRSERPRVASQASALR